MEPLGPSLDSVLGRVRGAHHVLLALDYDGTLTEIVPHPGGAYLPAHRRRLLRALSRRQGFTVVILSGRSLEDLKARVGVQGVVYGGNHGLEIEGPDTQFRHPQAEASRPFLDRLAVRLKTALAPLAGPLVEHKGLSLAVHYRLVPHLHRHRLQAVVQGEVDALGERVRLWEGKEVVEVLPEVEWDKGRALRWIAERCPPSRAQETDGDGLLLVYVGDDRTDEDAFAVVRGEGGIGVRVGLPVGPSLAHYYLPSPEEVTAFLRRMRALAPW